MAFNNFNKINHVFTCIQSTCKIIGQSKTWMSANSRGDYDSEWILFILVSYEFLKTKRKRRKSYVFTLISIE